MTDEQESSESTESTLDYLPEVYARACQAGSPLSGLVAASDALLLGLDRKLDTIHECFDPWKAEAKRAEDGAGPPGAASTLGSDLLSYLASWLDFERQLHWTTKFLRDLALDPATVQARRRVVVASAGRLARLRGTKRGLEQVLWGCLGVRVEVRERTWPNPMRIGTGRIGARVVGHYDPERMVEVVWRTSEEPKEELKIGFRRVVDLEVPAHLEVFITLEVDAPRAPSPPPIPETRA